MPKPVIAIAGLACETSTFTPSRTLAPAFHPPGAAKKSSTTLIGHALPGGMVTRDAYEELAEEIITRLRDIVSSTTLHGLWFDIHGAMCVEGIGDVEAELLHRIREVIGPAVLVSASMDLHGNVSRELAHQTDLITCYRTAPHEDEPETKERACRNLVELLAQQPNNIAADRMALPGVIDAAVWVGYAWADEPRNRAAVVVTGWETKSVAEGAERLARLFWDSRADFKFVAPTGSFAECIDSALRSTVHPFFISDSGDNPTAGGSGDVTWGLTQLLARSEFQDPTGPTVIYASLPGPKAVQKMVDDGIGATVTVTAGAEVDHMHSGPVTMTGRVHAIKHGDKDAVIEAVLQVGSVFAILTQLRKPYHHKHDFTDLNLNPGTTDTVIVKIGYLEPELFDMAAGWMLGLTPGGVDQDIRRLGHHRIHRPMWPFDTTFSSPPDLSARMISKSNDPLTGPDE
ncbi:M81 family metallopeptidase [Aspergillus tanneri]|uniref:Microcystin LR degradation protein MlrC N-terminal domain-containing protein n=1 Tax=Aspergillus tanneri TaxID=1220188 RepID=A0A5M9MFB3_9EURO|nr:uncharacterized protein ATNIH1004_007050 [Aspergillus tanneri]KAA8645631.1 hypothetical protein ATNIH1004_007050 [Aspergillus tanneri]